MTEKEINNILGDGYSWVKVKKFTEPASANPMVDWNFEYEKLMEHHNKETEFLINKCKELASYIKKNNILI